MGAPAQRRGQQEAQRDGQRQGAAPLRIHHAAARRDGDHHQAELAVIAQHRGGEQRGARRRVQQRHQREVKQRLEQREHAQQQRQDHAGLGGPALQADGQEEADQEHVLELHHDAHQLLALLVPREQRAQQQRAEVALDAAPLEQLRAADGDGEAAQGEQLAVSRHAQQAHQDSPRRPQRQQQEGLGVGQLALGESQEDNGGEILDDEYADGQLGVPRRHLALGLHHLDDEDRAGEGQGEGDQQCRGQFQPQVGQEHAGHQQQGGEEQLQQRHVNHGGAPDPRLQQLARRKLEADGEQQQRDAQVRQRRQQFTGLYVGLVQYEPCREVADQRGQADKAGEEAAAQGDDNNEGVEHGWPWYC